MRAAAPGFIILLAGLILPESPSSLAERGQVEKARHVSAPHFPLPFCFTSLTKQSIFDCHILRGCKARAHDCLACAIVGAEESKQHNPQSS